MRRLARTCLPRQAGRVRPAKKEPVVWHVAVELLFGLLWSAIAYVAIAATVRRSRWFAIGAALAAAAVVIVVIARTPRASALSANVGLLGAHPVSCSGAVALAPRAVQGAVDVVMAEPGAVALHDGGAVNRSSIIVLQGWATDRPPRHLATAVCLIVDGHVVASQVDVYGSGRGDVAAVFETPAVAASGYEIRAELAGLPAGTHEFTVVAVDASGHMGVIAPPEHFTLR